MNQSGLDAMRQDMLESEYHDGDACVCELKGYLDDVTERMKAINLILKSHPNHQEMSEILFQSEQYLIKLYPYVEGC